MDAAPAADADTARARDNPREMQVRAELVSTIYQHIPRSTAGVLVGAATVVWGLWSEVRHDTLLLWLAAIGAIMAWRIALYRAFPKNSPAADAVAYWERTWTISTGVHGSIWGSSALFMYVPDSPAHEALLLVALFAISTAAVPLVVRHLPSLYTFVLCVLVPIMVRLAFDGDDTQIALLTISALVMYGIFVFGTELHETITESVRRRYQNIELIEQLTDQTAKAEAARKDADEANRMKSRFLAAASHDLRQPMHALGLFSDSLRRRIRDPEERALADRICQSAESIEQTFDALMDISRLDAGVVQANIGPYSLQTILDNVARDCAAEAQSKGIKLRTRSTALAVRSDGVLLERIVRNLAANAVRYTERGGVLISCRTRSDTVSIEVWDTGIGIASDKHQRIFDEFYQAAERDRREGLGLGLAIVKRLARLLNAELTLRSEPGLGSVFKLRLPRSAPPASAPVNDPVASKRTLSALADAVVLVIDDDPRVLDAMTQTIVSWGMRAVPARSLDEALYRLPECGRYPDAIVSDFRLSERDTGIAAVTRIRHELGIDVPAMIVTGDIAPKSLRLIQDSGLPCLSKPVTAERLLQALGGLITTPHVAPGYERSQAASQ